MKTFTVVLSTEQDMYIAECPEVGTVSQGETVEETVANLREATELYLAEFPLEVGCAYKYILKKETLDPPEAEKRVKQLKPVQSETEVVVAISKAKEYLFTPSPADIEELRKETTPWQIASIKSMKE